MSKFDLGAIVAAAAGFVVPILVWARDAISRALVAVGASFRALWGATAVYLALAVVALGAFWGGHILGAKRAAMDRPALGFVAPPAASPEAVAALQARADAAVVAKREAKLALEAAQAEIARLKVGEAKLEKALEQARGALAEARQRRPVPRVVRTPAPAPDPTKAAWWPFKG